MSEGINHYTRELQKQIADREKLILQNIAKDYSIKEIRLAPTINATMLNQTFIHKYIIIEVKRVSWWCKLFKKR